MPLAAKAQESPADAPAASASAKIACKEKTRAVITTKDAQSIDAVLLSLDATGVDYQEKSPIDGEVKGRVAWPLLSAASANAVLKAGIDPKNAEQLVFAGRVLQGLPDGGAREADRWYALALKADANAKAQVEAAKKAEPLFPPVMEAGNVLQALPRINPEAWPAEGGKSMQEALATEAAMTDQGKHYGVAGDITRMLVECDPKRYGAFLGWLKQGANADTALKNSYGIDVEGLAKAYGKRIGCPGLKSH